MSLSSWRSILNNTSSDAEEFHLTIENGSALFVKLLKLVISQTINMTTQEILIEMAKLDGRDNMFVLMKRGLYYRPKACGYTDNINEAWVVDAETAHKHVYTYDEPVTKHQAPLPDYLRSLDASQAVRLKVCDTEERQRQYGNHLVQIISKRLGVEWQEVTRFQFASFTSLEDCEAILRVAGKWKE